MTTISAGGGSIGLDGGGGLFLHYRAAQQPAPIPAPALPAAAGRPTVDDDDGVVR